MELRLKILIPEGSSTSARQSITCLGRRHAIEILDPSWLCQCRFSKYVQRWHKCPRFTLHPTEYLLTVLSLLRSGKYDVLFPTHEQIYLLSRFQHLLEPHVALAVPEFHALHRMISKAQFVRLIDEFGLPQPVSKVVQTRDELLAHDQFPCWVKLDFSTAGQGVRPATNASELRAIADDFQRAGWFNGATEIVIQQHADGLRRGATGVFQHGRLIASHCCQGRGTGVGGSAKAKLSVHDPKLVAHMETLGSKLEWHGAMSLDYYIDERLERYQILECNPRIGESVLAMECGVDLCQCLVDVSLGQASAIDAPSEIGRKTHQGFLALTAMALDGASRRQIFRELVQAYRSRGIYEDSHDEITRLADDWMSAIPYIGVTGLLLLYPHAASWLVRKTVENYSLTSEAARNIYSLSISDSK